MSVMSFTSNTLIHVYWHTRPSLTWLVAEGTCRGPKSSERALAWSYMATNRPLQSSSCHWSARMAVMLLCRKNVCGYDTASAAKTPAITPHAGLLYAAPMPAFAACHS
jgi:hypothetical protein